MRVLITGSERGQLYWELLRTTPADASVVSLENRLDVTDATAVLACVEQNKPDVIINAAAYTAVDKAETDSDNAYAVNEAGVVNLANAANSCNAHLIHVSTDFVFGKSSASPFPTNAAVDPVSVYGKSKLAGEQQLQSLMPDSSLLVRTAWIYSSHGNNFVKTMLRRRRAVVNQYRY